MDNFRTRPRKGPTASLEGELVGLTQQGVNEGDNGNAIRKIPEARASEALSLSETRSADKGSRIGRCCRPMRDIFSLLWCALVGLFRSRASLEAEILLLRHQLNVLRRKPPKRMAFSNVDRLVFAGLYHLAPGVLKALKIVKPETVIRWHRAGFRAYWRRRSGPREGRPQTPLELRRLIRDVSLANPLWGAPRIHGELLKLGIEIGQTTVAKYRHTPHITTRCGLISELTRTLQTEGQSRGTAPSSLMLC